MNLRRETAKLLAKAIDDVCKFQQPTTIIAAPPSMVSDYPTAAVWMERFRVEYAQEDELTVDEDNNLLVGALATLAQPSGAAQIDDVSRLSKIGTASGSGRIWVGCRLSPRREEAEDQIRSLFLADAGAPGRLLLTIDNPKVAGKILPWPWTVACFVGNSEWTDEFAFNERLWAWLDFEIELDILVARNEALIETVILGINAKTFAADGVSALDEDPEVVAVNPATEYFTLDSDGNVVQYNP